MVGPGGARLKTERDSGEAREADLSAGPIIR